jgi:hypothetical protein
MMNRTKLSILGLAALAAGLAGCSDLEETPISGVTADHFRTAEGAQAAATGAYARLRDFYGQEREVILGQLGTDSWEKGSEVGNAAPFNDYTATLAANMSLAENRNNWQNNYQGVNAANTAIAYLGETTALPADEKRVRIAEARFLRALYHFNLLRTYGSVQLSLAPVQEVVTTASRTPVDSVYGAIVADLDSAVAALPAAQPQFGRATRGAAQTLLAEVYLTRAAAGDFDRARTLTTAVISSGTYTLNPTFRGIFCGPDRVGAACDFIPANETNRELIWSVQFTGDAGNDQWGNSLHLYYVMAYDIVGAPDLPRTVEYGRPYRRLRPTLHLLRLWNRDTDSRYDDTFQTLWVSATGTRDTAIFLTSTPTVPAQNQGKRYRAFGESQYTGALFPTLRKWLNQDRQNDPQRTQGGRDRHLWRLADVYLMRAEANIRAGRVSEAVADFNVLRARAAKPGRVNTIGATEQAALTASPIEFLLDERERELAGEELRWYTLARLNKLVDRVKAYNPGGGPNVQPKHQLRPIPQEQIDRTEGGAQAFPQNPGY